MKNDVNHNQGKNRDMSGLVYWTLYKTKGTRKWINVSSQTKISISFFSFPLRLIFHLCSLDFLKMLESFTCSP